MAKIQLNGKKVVIKSNYSLFDLLKKYKLSNKKIAVEHNGVIIQKANYKKKYLSNNDKVEVEISDNVIVTIVRGTGIQSLMNSQEVKK